MGYQEQSAEGYVRPSIGKEMHVAQYEIHGHKLALAGLREVASRRTLTEQEIAAKKAHTAERRRLHRKNHELYRQLMAPLGEHWTDSGVVAGVPEATEEGTGVPVDPYEEARVFVECESARLEDYDFTGDPILARIRQEMGPSEETGRDSSL